MNIVYLMGNGFDRNLNLPTDYQSFYNYYISTESSSETIAQLKQEIGNNYKNWSDLEEALGIYLQNVHSEDDAKIIHTDILLHLQRYICDINSTFNPIESKRQVFLTELFNPVRSLRLNQRNRLLNGVLRTEQNRNLYIISFNYTETIEKLLNYKGESIRAFSFRSNYDSYIREIEHIHGFCDPQKGRMALGVDNESQIINKSICSSNTVRYRYIKPVYNELYGSEHHKKCIRWINTASFICIFGMSLGISDNTWWNAIGKRLSTSDAVLLYFYYPGFELKNNNGPEFQEQIDEIKDSLIPRLGIKDASNTDIRERIYISCNKTMFKYNDTIN